MNVNDFTTSADTDSDQHDDNHQIAMHTDIGSRESNQDRADYRIGPHGLMMVLGDGLGGHEGGELAAETFVNQVLWSYDKVASTRLYNPFKFIVTAVVDAHRAIVRSAASMDYDPYSPKTTGIICLIQDGYAYWGHIGDSRLYHYRAGALSERTRDHTPTEQKRQRGLISEDDMRLAEHQSPISRCIGGRRRSIVTLGNEIALERGDLILMCSDGMWRAFDNRELYQRLSQHSLESGLVGMAGAARKQFRQHCDNITAVAMRWQADVTQAAALRPQMYGDDDQIAFWKRNSSDEQQKSALDLDGSVPRPSSKQRLLEEITDFDQAIDDIEKLVENLS